MYMYIHTIIITCEYTPSIWICTCSANECVDVYVILSVSTCKGVASSRL